MYELAEGDQAAVSGGEVSAETVGCVIGGVVAVAIAETLAGPLSTIEAQAIAAIGCFVGIAVAEAITAPADVCACACACACACGCGCGG